MMWSVKELLASIRESCSSVSDLPAGFVRDLIMEQVGTDVSNRIAAVNLAVATQLSDRVLDEVTDALKVTSDQLVSLCSSVHSRNNNNNNNTKFI